MAAHSPRDPDAPSDESNVFRRSAPKPTPPVDPEEPLELLDFEEIPFDGGDEDALDVLDSPHGGDSPSVIVRRGYSDGSSVNLGGSPLGESGSSIFAHGDMLSPSAPGSGWFDTIPPVIRTIAPAESSAPSDVDLSDAEFVESPSAGPELRRGTDSSAVPISGWQDHQATNAITESEVIRAFDNLSGRTVVPRPATPDDSPDFDRTQPSGSNLFSNTEDADIGGDGSAIDFGLSGVDLLNPERDEERFTGPKSSIFGAVSHEEGDGADAGGLPPETPDDLTTDLLFAEGDAGSSIFNKTSPFLSLEEEADAIAFTPVGADSGERPSGTIEWSTKPLPEHYQPTMSAPFEAEDGADPFADALVDLAASPTPAPSRGPVGTAGAGAVVAPLKSRYPEEDEDEEDPIEAPKPKRKREPVRVQQKPQESKRGGGLVAWLGGGTLGVLAGAGAFAGLYFADVLPAKDLAKVSPPSVSIPPSEKDPNAELLAAAQAKADEAQRKVKLMETELATATAAGIKSQADAEASAAERIKADKERRTALKLKDEAEADAKAAQLAVTKADDEAKKALLLAKKAGVELELAQTEAEKATADAKGATLDAEKAKTDAKLQLAINDKVTKDLDAAKKALEDRTKAALDAEAKTLAVQKKLKGAEDGVDLVVAELKANKLLDGKLDTPEALARVPDIFKRLAALAATPDAKKAAEALLAAKKDLETSQAALKSAEATRSAAEKELKLAQQVADEKVAAAMKKADADVLAAKLETDAAKKEAEAQLAVAVTKATADAKKKLADAEVARAADDQRHKSEVAAIRESFAGQLAEARQGGALQITPAEVLTQDRAARDYNAGVRSYQARSFPAALASLESAVKLDPVDARHWYYLGLTQLELGRKDEARAAFRKGSELEGRSKPNATAVGESLERIQGAARKELNSYR